MAALSRSIAWPAVLFALAFPAVAQDPCTLTPYDGSNENGLGAAPGFLIELCSEIDVPAVCLDRGNYFINAVQVEATRTSGDTTMPFTAQVRRAVPPAAGPPVEIVAGPVSDEVQGVPSFPQSQTWVTTTLGPGDRFSVGFDAVQLTSACVVVDGDQAMGQFFGTDETPATPINLCWKGDPPGLPNEDCRNGAPDLRALRVGLRVAPHGGVADGSQQNPPVPTSATGTVRLGPNQPGGTSFWLEVVHDVPNPTAAHIHEAPPGSNGPIVVPLGDPTSPIVLPDVDMTGLLDELFAGNLYVNVHTAANPGGEIRGQIGSAGDLIFADGFESGDTTAWGSTVP
ncbi:MAG: CHRD domain-containing protein [Acidobacteriota bacterium]|nr:CHRD domain-containing protein [Acidobacteriota bacterium]MDH3525414.1 CHRD domain-containing protein [Acidobacteriota bacterium]